MGLYLRTGRGRKYHEAIRSENVRVKTKIYIFIGAIFAVLLIGLFAGWNFTAIGSSIVGLGGAIWAALRGRRIPRPYDATDAAYNAVYDDRAESSGNDALMES